MSKFQLTISDLRLWVSLGCSEQEKFLPQCISIDIYITFLECPEGSHTDNIKDVICYAELTKEITEFCKDKKFNLIEYLASEIYNLISNSILTEYEKITVKIAKLKSPIEGIHGSISFTYSK